MLYNLKYKFILNKKFDEIQMQLLSHIPGMFILYSHP